MIMWAHHHLASSCHPASLSLCLPPPPSLPPSRARGTATLPKRIVPGAEIPLNTTVPHFAGGGGKWKRRRDLNASRPSCSGSPSEVVMPLCLRGPTSRNFTAALMQCNIAPSSTTCFVWGVFKGEEDGLVFFGGGANTAIITQAHQRIF